MFTLVRHGESQANACLDFKTLDVASIELTALGWKQAAALANTLPVPDRVILSPYIRARQTAEPTLAKYAVPTIEMAVQEFTYLAPYPNSTTSDRAPRIESYWSKYDPHYREGDVAESFSDLIYRVEALLSRSYAGHTVVFTHGQFMKAVIHHHIHGYPTPTAKTMRSYHAFITNSDVPNCAMLPLMFYGGVCWMSCLYPPG
jgi:broad specificity phosphatase PhoE